MRLDRSCLTAAPRIETDRLVLRAHSSEDFKDCAALWGNADVTRFIGGSPRPPQDAWFRILRYAGHWALLGYGFWAIVDKASGKFLGEGGFGDFQRGISTLNGVPEMGWALAPAAWGKGIAKEAVTAFADWGDANFTAAETGCIISPENRASIRVADYAGFSVVDEITYNGVATLIFKRTQHASRQK